MSGCPRNVWSLIHPPPEARLQKMISPSNRNGPSRRSPFPGMDPWVEDSWGDMHTRLTTYACDALQPGLPDGLRARVEEYMSIVAGDYAAMRRPDISVVKSGLPESSSLLAAGTDHAASAVAVEDEPILLPRYTDPLTLRNIQIVDTRHGKRLITSIEFLSPSNKIGIGRESFRQKQDTMIQGGVNIIEIDLLRIGDWSVSIPRTVIPEDRCGTYRACVVRGASPSMCEYYAIRLDHRLPNIRIPLRTDDADIILSLQPLFQQAYQNGAYGSELDYSQPPSIALGQKEMEMARPFLVGAQDDESQTQG